MTDVMIDFWKLETPTVISTVPAWAMVYLLRLQEFFYIPRVVNLQLRSEQNAELIYESIIVSILRCLQEYGEQTGERMSLTLGIVDRDERGKFSPTG